MVVRVFLYLTDDECEVCRERGPIGVLSSGGQRCLHLSASAGSQSAIDDADHVLPLDYPAVPAQVARTRQPFVTADVTAALQDVPADVRRRVLDLGVKSACG